MSNADGRDESPSARSPYLTPGTAASPPSQATPEIAASPPVPVSEPTAPSVPSAASAGEAAPNEESELASGPTERPDPAEPSDPAESTDPAEPSDSAEASDSAELGGDAEPQRVDRNWMGVAAFVAGALLLSVVAIVLGHLGLSAAKRGRANNRTFSVAGLILGYVGLVLTAVGAWLLLDDRPSAADIDVHAQQDVAAVGAAAAEFAIDTGQVPSVSGSDDGYIVGDSTIAAELEVPHELTFTGAGPADWCVQITYEGGQSEAFSYTAAGGLIPGQCPAAG